MTVNSVLNVILPFNNCDSIPPLEPRSQGINPSFPAIQGLISPRKATPACGVPADLSCSSVLYLSAVTGGGGGRGWGCSGVSLTCRHRYSSY